MSTQAREAGSTGSAGTANNLILMLATEEIGLPVITDVRPVTGRNESEAELKDIESLMRSIEEEGQIEPVIVIPRVGAKDGEPQFDMVAGRRRLKAVTMHNLAAQVPMKVKAILADGVKNVGALFRRAMHENIMRAEINPIDMAYNFATIRREMKFNGPKGTKKVAEFVGCSEAQVSQTEKLLELEEEFRKALAEGRLMREGAYALLRVKPSQRAQVFKDAVELQAAEPGGAAVGEGAVLKSSWELAEQNVHTTQSLAEARAEAGVGVEEGVSEPEEAENAPTGQPGGKKGGSKRGTKRAGGAKKGGVTAGSIKKAARRADPDAKQPQSRKDILDWFEGLMGPAFGYADGAVHKFCAKFALWVRGEAQDRALLEAFKVMVEGASKGNPPKETAKAATKAADKPAKAASKTKTTTKKKK